MKRRYRYTLNILSFSLLFVALYLNFVKEEPADVSEAPATVKPHAGAEKDLTKTSAVSHKTATFDLR